MRSLRRNHGHALVVVGGIASYALFGLILWWLLDSYIDPNAATAPSNAATAPSSISTAKKDLMQAWSFVMAGVAGVIGIYFTWRNLKQTQDSTQQTLELTKRGQDTERFTRAVDQLGNDKSEVRIGGVYALERIAEDSKEHYWPVIEVITSYIRTHATRDSVEKVFNSKEKKRHQHPMPDVQAALYALAQVAQRDNSHDPKEDDDNKGDDYKFINLSHSDLRNADLRGANLKKARLRQGSVKLTLRVQSFVR